MDTKTLFDTIYAVGFIVSFTLIPCISEVILKLLCRISPGIHRWVDNHCDNSADLNDEMWG